MKKSGIILFSLLTALFISFSGQGKSQSWVVYDASVLPPDNTPAFTAGDNSPAADFVAEVIDDPEIAANKLFKYDHADTTGKQTYKMSWEIGGGTAATIVARIKGIAGSPSKRIAEIDVRNVNSGVGSKLQIGYDDSVRLESPSLSAYLANAKEWHLYRLVMNGADFSVYIDENPTALLSGTSTKSRTDNWFKFGDQSASYSHSGLFDYIIWDVTGAFAPGQGAAIPENLSRNFYTNTTDYLSIPAVTLYPNPSSGQITISLTEDWTDGRYDIFNSLGQKTGSGLISGANTDVSTANLTDGVYTLVIRRGDDILHRERFIHKASAN